MKFQFSYLEYPYFANIAISKNNQLIVLLVRKNNNSKALTSGKSSISLGQNEKAKSGYDDVLDAYYEQCE